jgi:SAM-dependent methyltransferase
MSDPNFDDLTEAYEAMIDWPKRLGNEEGFFRKLFEEVGARSVLDAACGTGHHAAMFASWGLHVEGADISPAMIERARGQFGESDLLRWVMRGFDQPIPEPGTFDVAVCIGNSLALAPDETTVATAIRQMLLALRPGGTLVVQVLNLWRLADGPCNWQKCRRAALPQGDSLIIKGVHRCGAQGYVDLLITRLEGEEPQMRADCVPFLGLEAGVLAKMAMQAGAAGVEFYGGYQRQGYQREKSQDLVLIVKTAL